MLMGTADRDYNGAREAEQDVSDATEVKLDYSARRLIPDLQIDAENICRVEIAPDQFQHRVPVVSPMKMGTKLLSGTSRRLANGSIRKAMKASSRRRRRTDSPGRIGTRILGCITSMPGGMTRR